ncbi:MULTISPECIES: gliding motility lipoprotein GldK [Salegentibacter]|jgi:gliding motility-associated lipoprotein GldK|uniref:Protein involved in gliding motility GldK n=2 Tax=Salegentibacter TaxID=143222 RepID=A0A1I2NRD8_9FLAO|nr:MULTISPECIES: gliding motility lipoprotein GldK [Salegentibacter]APS38497.1 gliding motility lipoprotein GldK [Salegentibacter sp. T436]MBO2544015.1 gliding motility lipoprotein GldK [Salegentibacter sp. BDJ18]SFG03996.1 protein involved in gliding motility GldK [Salegentibacter agarivorans]
MKKFISLIAVLALLSSCGRGDRGQLVGAKGEKWNPEKPLGMTLIPGGSFIMGKSDDDIAGQRNAPPKTVTVRSFYMDETEITNAEYRQFVNDVKDSIVRTELAIMAENMGEAEGSGGIGDYAFMDADEGDMTPYEEYMLNTYGQGGPSDTYENRRLNKDIDIIWDTEDYPDVYYAEVMDMMYIPMEEVYNGQRTIDVEKLKFTYTWMDVQGAAKKQGNRSDYIKREEIQIYPDTTVWIRDFNYSYNEPMHNDYFWHSAFDDYPVVGVTWKQARAFTQWRTLYHNYYRREKGEHNVPSYRLPTEGEWEYAARGGLEGATYPWGGPYAKNDRGCFMANFKPLRGDYAADQALYTVEAQSYDPNDYGLYNMAGNVAEWVDSSYDPASYEYMSSMNPTVNNPDDMRKVVRGGSWKDVAYFLQVSSRDYEYADSARSYIGFRTVQDYLGTDVTLNQPNR